MQQQIALQGNIFSGDMQAMGQAESTRQFDEQMAENTRQFDKQMAAADAENKWNLAMAFIENGKNASFISETLGIPQADVNTLISAVNAQKKVSSGGRSSGAYKAADTENTNYLKSLLPVIKDSGLTVTEWIANYGSSYGITSASDKKELIGLARNINSERK